MDRVCLFEIPYADQSRAEKFYREVFGWQIYPAPTEIPYLFAITTPLDEKFQPAQPGGINGGMFPRGAEGGSTAPVVVIEVDSCDQRVADVEAAGGARVMGPLPIAQLGIYAQVKDSEDNIIGLWQPLAPPAD
ncbi:MAG: VOC family protein [Planctomycetales bacterium]|nr:VOC family protein [Planctomycetales bacterium]